ncbi:MAG: mechanosensitive ion channel family protein [Calditrichaceae bacterium]
MNRSFLSAIFILAIIIGIFDCQPSYGQAVKDTLVQADSISVTNNIKEKISSSGPKIPWSISFGKIIWSFLIFLIAFIVIKYLTRLLEALAERFSNLRLTIKGLVPILRIAGWTFILYIIIAGIIAPPIETLIAVTASAGIAVGFASQDILKNIFGGIMILFDRPFQAGDKIEVGSYYGEVVQIGLRTVRIVTADDSLVSIPNSEIVNQSVSNSNSGESNCQVVAEFYLPPNIDLIRAKKIAFRAAAVSKYIYLNKPIAIIIKNEIHEGRSLLKMRLKAYVNDIRYEFAFASEMTEIVITEFLNHKLITADEMSFINGKN